jgi:hypothetical protein
MGARRTSQSGRKPVASRLWECVGFRVEASPGLLGIVDALRSRSDRDQELVVRAGKHCTRFLILLADDVAEWFQTGTDSSFARSFTCSAPKECRRAPGKPHRRASEAGSQRGGVPRRL